MDLIETNNNKNRHPWELSRTSCLINEINKIHNNGDVLDIGCGDKYFDKELIKTNNKISNLRGVDIYAKNTIKEKNCLWTNSYNKLDIKKYKTIIMMDVLEHIEDDVDFLLNTVKCMLDSNGKIILTVPAFQSLFSEHDKKLKHYRRYNIKLLKDTCAKSNLVVKNYHYFYFSLLVVRLLTKKKNSEINNWKYSENNIITKLLVCILNLDYYICKYLWFIFPGLSLFAVIEKKQ